MRLDNLDRHIIACLTEDARRSFRDVGEEVGLSAPAVKRRVDRLALDGVITGFTTQLAPEAFGLRVQAFVELFCRGKTSPAQLARLAAAHPEVRSAWTVTGEADAILLLHAEDMGDLEAALERIREHSTVDHTRSIIVLSTLLER
ncbi:MAG: Lrp/AsnC family transcriptional regulator [Jatrophihabitans sp.]